MHRWGKRTAICRGLLQRRNHTDRRRLNWSTAGCVSTLSWRSHWTSTGQRMTGVVANRDCRRIDGRRWRTIRRRGWTQRACVWTDHGRRRSGRVRRRSVSHWDWGRCRTDATTHRSHAASAHLSPRLLGGRLNHTHAWVHTIHRQHFNGRFPAKPRLTR